MYSRNAFKVGSLYIQLVLSFQKLCDELIGKEKNYSTEEVLYVAEEGSKRSLELCCVRCLEKQKYALRTIS
jgi:hypothetical protein